jgi:group II intron reverse transcriptase/maturase
MHEDLMEQVVEEENLERALRAVERKRGAAGIDKMTTQELEPHFRRHGAEIRAKLLAGRWTPSPVRRVEIPKPSGGKRQLGIPTVMDRLLQQALLQVLQPIFDPRFSESSYGFRPRRSAHDAVRAAQGYVREGKDWVVDIDIARFFDVVNHDILMRRVAAVIRDKRVLRLIGRYLRAGVLAEGVVVRSAEGTPQGGPLSPLLANIYLDALDRELENRELRFCRYADDCNIYVSSEAAAKRVLTGITAWIGKHLRLKVNEAKSGAGRPWERKFLGFRLNRQGQVEAAPESIERFKRKVREIWCGNRSVTSRQLRDEWQRYVRGWWGYYRLAERRRAIFQLEGWVRRHIRKCFWLRWHGATGRRRALRRLGIGERLLKLVPARRGAWRLAANGLLQTALSNATLLRYGFVMPSHLAAGR